MKWEITKNDSQIMKGVAIIAIILCHIMGHYFSVSEYIRNVLGTGGVSVFLFLSGYGLYMSYKATPVDSLKYWNSKINKIFVPYWIITVVYFLLFMSNENRSFLVLLKNLVFIDYKRHIDGTMWYMSLLIIWYLVFYILFKYNIPTYMRIVLMICVALFLKENYTLFEKCGWQFLQNFMSFPVGVLFSIIIANGKRDEIKKGKIINSVLFLIFMCIYIFAIVEQLDFQLLGLLAIVVLYLGVKLLSKLHYVCKVLLMVGSYSYILYLIEGKLFNVLPHFSNHYLSLIVYICTLVVITVVYAKLTSLKNKKCFSAE